ncbi:MAG: selenide, water dikinase SelD [Pseudomonadota bacterium]
MSEKSIRLTQMVEAGGCAAKMGPGDLKKVVARLARCVDPRLLVGPETLDDAAVVRVSDDLAVCFTTDFITPLVDDPRDWGRIAATNAISDVYAMGATPLMALNLVCWSNCLPMGMLSEVLAGGADAAQAAGCIVGGGHSIHDKEPKYGMAVIGTVHPDRILCNRGARPGDLIYLSKPLGTGIICTALKGGTATEEEKTAAVASMTTLNRGASEAAIAAGAHALTDVTGFSLIGHLCGMLGEAKELGASISCAPLPLLPGVLRHIADETVPGGAFRNRDTFGGRVDIRAGVDDAYRIAIFDPQTSGGLMAAIAPEMAARFEEEAKKRGVDVYRIGEFDGSGRITVIA